MMEYHIMVGGKATVYGDARQSLHHLLTVFTAVNGGFLTTKEIETEKKKARTSFF